LLWVGVGLQVFAIRQATAGKITGGALVAWWVASWIAAAVLLVGDHGLLAQ